MTFALHQAGGVAAALLETVAPSKERATVVGLSGDLGAGKTTITQALARELSVAETVVSPTFVIAKFYGAHAHGFTQLVHIDAYRIVDTSELEPLGFQSILAQPETLVVIEWPENIAPALTSHTVSYYRIKHHEDTRHISGPYEAVQ